MFLNYFLRKVFINSNITTYVIVIAKFVCTLKSFTNFSNTIKIYTMILMPKTAMHSKRPGYYV